MMTGIWRFALAASFCSSAVSAAVPSGATTSPEALRQAYIDACETHSLAALETLFAASALPAEYHIAFQQFLTEGMANKIETVVISDMEPKLRDEFRKAHAHFPYPVIKVITINYHPACAKCVNLSQYYIGTKRGKYFFVTADKADR